MRRTVLTLALALWSLLSETAPAAAHGAGGMSATNYLTRMRDVTPTVPGLRMQVVEAGRRFELTNTGPTDVVVLGYQAEPYLRIGPEGVFHNLRSASTYVNTTREGDVTVPGTVDPTAPPEWQRTSDGRTARWHDHRIHWMAEEDPPAVRRDPDRRHVVLPDWTIPMRVGDRTVEAKGELLWVPGPSPAPWLAVAGALLVLSTLAVLLGPWALTAGLVAVLAAGDVVHAIGADAATAGGGVLTRILRVLIGSLAIVGWAAAIAAVRLLLRSDRAGFIAAGVAGAVLALYGGFTELGSLSRSQLPFAWSPALGRVLVAVSLGAGLGLFAGSTLRMRREPEPEPAVSPD